MKKVQHDFCKNCTFGQYFILSAETRKVGLNIVSGRAIR